MTTYTGYSRLTTQHAQSEGRLLGNWEAVSVFKIKFKNPNQIWKLKSKSKKFFQVKIVSEKLRATGGAPHESTWRVLKGAQKCLKVGHA